MGAVRTLPRAVAGVRLADAVKVFLGTITVGNTRRGYAAALDRLVGDFGADTDVAGLDPDRVSGWFVFVWGRQVRENVQPSVDGAVVGVRVLA
jgi:integrase/recombinase XerC/integrase/recombinase XerD